MSDKEIAVSKISKGGKFSLPKNVRNMLGIDDGDRLGFYLEDNKIVIDRVVMQRIKKKVQDEG